MRVLMCAGGTGGGIYPALAAATALQTQGVQKKDILWIGTKGEMEETLVPRAGIILETINGGPIVGVPMKAKLRNAARLVKSIGTAANTISRFAPHVMFTTGAYVAAPVALAARRHSVPIVIYLPDVEPGSTIRYLLPLARKIACTTEDSKEFIDERKMVVTGYPVRPEIRAARSLTRAEALDRFDLKPGRPTLFVFGGSRGARTINRALMNILPVLLEQCQVIHISGNLTWPEVMENKASLTDAQSAYYRPYPYLHEEMGAAFRAADLVIARAGASMLGECPCFGLPAILIPLTFAWRYQKVNADFLADRGAAIQLTDESLAGELFPTIQSLLADPARLAKMSAAAAALDKPDAATDLARLLMSEANTTNRQDLIAADEEALC